MNLLHEGRNILFIDFESSGVFGKSHSNIEITEVAMKLYTDLGTNQQTITQYQQLYRIDGTLSDFMIKHTGITPEMLKGQPHYSQDQKVIQQFVSQADIIVAHGAKLELKSLRMIGINLENTLIFDTLLFTQKLIPNLSKYGMQNLRKYFKIPNGNAHRAMGDVDDMITIYHALTDQNHLSDKWSQLRSQKRFKSSDFCEAISNT